MSVRPALLHYFDQTSHGPKAIRGQNFTLRRFGPAPEAKGSICSADETLVIFSGAGGTVETAEEVLRVPPRSLVIAPPGTTVVETDGPAAAYALTTGAAADAERALNAGDYRVADPRVRPVGAVPGASGICAPGLRLYPVDKIPFPAGNARLKFLRTATMSINWVEYDGPRPRSQLSPHAHEDFEQGSLAISGAFVHHIRTPWGRDADEWREDAHIEASDDSLLIIPPTLIHTTEGVGDGPHVLIDIFAPAREDFLAKGWVHNAGDYAEHV